MESSTLKVAALKLLAGIKNGNRELLTEAHHLLGKFLDYGEGKILSQPVQTQEGGEEKWQSLKQFSRQI